MVLLSTIVSYPILYWLESKAGKAKEWLQVVTTFVTTTGVVYGVAQDRSRNNSKTDLNEGNQNNNQGNNNQGKETNSTNQTK